jgi:hypothetical protein
VPDNPVAFQHQNYEENKIRQNEYDDGGSNVLIDYNYFYISFGILPFSHSSSLFSLYLPTVMAPPESIPSGTRSKYNIASDKSPNSPTQDTQLPLHAQNPHREATDMATNIMHNVEQWRIVHKYTAQTHNEKHAVGYMLFN